MKPIVTVGICARNSESTLRCTIDSIINQNFEHDKMQIVFVDDGSEDHTLKIMTDYVNKMDITTVVFHTKWQGLGPARNLVFRNADGKYITWVDADEILPPDYISKQVEFMEENPDVGITAGVFGFVPGNLILNLELMPSIFSRASFEEKNTFIWKTERLIGSGGSTYCVEALKQVNGFNEQLKGAGEDVDVARRIKRAGWVIRLNEAQFYELHGGLSNFKDLWKKYSWYGFGAEKIYRENQKLFSFPRMSPIAGVITGLLYSMMGYRLISQKKVFLLPIHFGIKMTAWSFGFMKGQLSRP